MNGARNLWLEAPRDVRRLIFGMAVEMEARERWKEVMFQLRGVTSLIWAKLDHFANAHRERMQGGMEMHAWFFANHDPMAGQTHRGRAYIIRWANRSWTVSGGAWIVLY